MGTALVTDFYELTMASSYIQQGMTAPATFSLFVRQLPPTRGFLIVAGLEECLQYLEAFRFEKEDLAYLASLGFPDEVLHAFASLRFTGDVWAIPEGRVVLANEPLLEITAPMPEAQLIETYLLNKVTFHTAVASKAARCIIGAQGRFELVDFGLRRTQGLEAGMAAARTSAMVGFSATSNVEAARRYGLTPSGTMAHSYVEAFPEEIDAFRAFARDFPERTNLLVDTYDTLMGVTHAIEVIRELGLEQRAGIRLDSGDLSALAHGARQLLDAAGLDEVRIVVSGSLDEHRLARLVRDGAPVDVAGVGTRMGVSADSPYLDTAYKLVVYDGRPVAKLSTDKATYPGAKQVFRAKGVRDMLGLRDERPPKGTMPVLELAMKDGHRFRPPEALEVQRTRYRFDAAELPASAMELVDPVAPTAEVTAALASLTEQVRSDIRLKNRSVLG
jgi:nicotinate phosphoribosyltransferase